MKKTLLILGLVLVAILCIAVLTGCEKKSEASGIVGEWEYVNGGYTYKFNADKTGSYSAGSLEMEFTYEDDGSKVSILYKDNTMATDHEYKIEGDKLIIKDDIGSDVEYVKK